MEYVLNYIEGLGSSIRVGLFTSDGSPVDVDSDAFREAFESLTPFSLSQAWDISASPDNPDRAEISLDRY